MGTMCPLAILMLCIAIGSVAAMNNTDSNTHLNCPNSCSEQGICEKRWAESRCRCFAGRNGVDCSEATLEVKLVHLQVTAFIVSVLAFFALLLFVRKSAMWLLLRQTISTVKTDSASPKSKSKMDDVENGSRRRRFAQAPEDSGPEDIAVTKFREYLRVKTELPNPDREGCNKFLLGLAQELGIPCKIYEVVPGNPIVVMTIVGSDPSLKAILLNSHTDVVPTFPDMKCVGSQYVEAIRRHFMRGIRQWKRTIHFMFGPDEELGGLKSTASFIQTDDFKKLNIGFVLDEGVASENDTYLVFYAERSHWWFTVTFNGPPGHGSQFVKNTAMEKMYKFMEKAMEFREEQGLRLERDSTLEIGDVFTINLTVVKGGVQVNVVPEKFELSIDLRIPPTANLDEVDKMLHNWANDAGGDGITFDFTDKSRSTEITQHTSADPFFAALEKSWNELCCKIHPTICLGGTDAKHMRKAGLPAIGFSPMINTKYLAHNHNEFINEKVFLRGVEIYEKLIDAIASVENAA